MTNDILIFKKKNILTLFTTKEGLNEVQKIIKQIEPFKKQYTTVHILEHSKESFSKLLDMFHIDKNLKFKNLIVISTNNYTKDLVGSLNIDLNINEKKAFKSITSYLKIHTAVMEKK